MRFICPDIKGNPGEVPPHTPEEQAMPYAARVTGFFRHRDLRVTRDRGLRDLTGACDACSNLRAIERNPAYLFADAVSAAYMFNNCVSLKPSSRK
jgi:hypothetical protein